MNERQNCASRKRRTPKMDKDIDSDERVLEKDIQLDISDIRLGEVPSKSAKDDDDKPIIRIIVDLVLCLLCGVMFGICFEKGRGN